MLRGKGQGENKQRGRKESEVKAKEGLFWPAKIGCSQGMKEFYGGTEKEWWSQEGVGGRGVGRRGAV